MVSFRVYVYVCMQNRKTDLVIGVINIVHRIPLFELEDFTTCVVGLGKLIAHCLLSFRQKFLFSS